jgi:hypothetical protein
LPSSKKSISSVAVFSLPAIIGKRTVCSKEIFLTRVKSESGFEKNKLRRSNREEIVVLLVAILVFFHYNMIRSIPIGR